MKFLQTLCNVERQVDEKAVRFTLDFVRAEEDVGLEEVQCLVENVRFPELFGGRSPELRLQRQNGHVPDDLGRLQEL